MRNPRESQYLNGAIPPDPEEANQLNALHGPIPQPSRLLKGTAAVLGLGTVAFLADGCARPDQPAEVRPTQSEPVPTAQRGLPEGYFTAIAAATPRPPKSSPTPTETPKPVEKGIVGDWRFTPVSIEETPSRREGYKNIKLTLTVQNQGRDLKIAEAMVEDFGFRIQGGSGFAYPENQSMKGRFRGSGFSVPPNYPLPFDVNIEVPAGVKDGTRLSLGSKSFPQKQIVWDIGKEFPPPPNQPIEYKPQTNLKQIGESLKQLSLEATPLETKLVMAKPSSDWWGGPKWYLGFKLQSNNKYGYDLDWWPSLVVFDKEGNVWSEFGFSGSDFASVAMKSIPPGVQKTQIAYVSLGNVPRTPDGLTLMIRLPASPKMQADENWALYRLDESELVTFNHSGFMPSFDIAKVFSQK